MRVPQEVDGQLHASQPNQSSYMELAQTQMTRRPQLLRATTDVGPRNHSPSPIPSVTKDDDNWVLRHGWEQEYNSEEYLTALNSVSLVSHTHDSR